MSDLARRVAETAAAAQPGLALEEQLRLNPTGVIGVEDITAATWLRLGLDINLQPNGRTALRRRNAAVARHAARVAAGLDQSTVSYLPVAGAMDYDTANDAGRVFAAAGLSGAAIGFGAYMADDSYTDAYKQGGRWHRLPTRMPQRYLRTVLVARGFWDGWNDETGGAPGHFHFLGLGAPIMIGLVAIAAGRTPTLTFDATSPIRDAVDGTFYLTRPAYLKIRARRIAERLIAATAERWQCHCPFCQQFTRSHPFDYPAGLAWRATRPTGRVSAADLRPGGGLYTAFPLLSEPGGGQLRKDIDRARIGHNHWTLQRIITAINTAAKQGRLPQHMDEVVTAYERASNAESFAAAVRFAHTLATEDRP